MGHFVAVIMTIIISMIIGIVYVVLEDKRNED